jgi:predicted RNase H-related nuclease YkuK (DUF458 family)
MGTLNKNDMVYKRLFDGTDVNLTDYIRDYVETHNDVDILIGCDSQNYVDKTTYAIVVALYHRGKGAHVLYKRWKTQREHVRATRLLNEVWYAVETAEAIKNAGLPKVKWIDIDLNPDPRYKSNEVFRQAVGMVEGMGYQVRYKTLGPIATYAADHLVKI